MINLFELQNKFLATQLMVGSFSLRCVRRKNMCLRWEKGKLQIKEEISLLRIASLGDGPSATSASFTKSCNICITDITDQRITFTDIFIPRKNQTPVEWKVLFLNVWLTCVLSICAENGHISSDSFFFHIYSTSDGITNNKNININSSNFILTG